MSIATFFICIATCVAYEAMRINGWLNRFASRANEKSFLEWMLDRWEPSGLLVYGAIFLVFVTVLICRNFPRVRMGWFLFAIVMFLIACINIPGAIYGRYANTSDFFMLFYIVVVPIPALVFIIAAVATKVGTK